ncbi:hypothetical protein AA103196_2109 [Ameyamaea chiangmaiensis NBRC 103196]|uniref:DUF3108 domain-containing protein n=1 Tax=Ameyamaea chiangmaiensis TaxID=442969 RepID=A0A850P9E4_9PROT|nr:DUF3108 domain-containing protein [Ameyamaea chiangmaiensis]MBS4073625.1 DUF3108 domain-containing protein [Ameyamaea chiangmaiensis]NVN41197.1 DUF3108 domain-containing protein [Ameyamaea chiangmaiensis]GBQ69024.1 hypothetical protein AA103196_2109 [Ameyamaea chiangmaiensis NBRC 103196]
MRRLAGVALGVLFTVAGMASPVRAATYPDGAVTLRYAVYLHGFHVVDVHTGYTVNAAAYDVRTTLQTDGIWAVFLKMNITSTGTGRFAGDAVAPTLFQSDGFSRGHDRHLTIRYADGTPSVAVLDPPETDRVPVEADQRAGSIDTLSAMMLMLGTLDRTGQCDGSAKVFDGLRLITMSSHSAGKQALPPDRRLSFTGDAVRCDFVGQQVAGFVRNSRHEAQMRKPQPGSVWFQNLQGYGMVAVRIELNHPKIGKLTVLLAEPPGH